MIVLPTSYSLHLQPLLLDSHPSCLSSLSLLLLRSLSFPLSIPTPCDFCKPPSKFLSLPLSLPQNFLFLSFLLNCSYSLSHSISCFLSLSKPATLSLSFPLPLLISPFVSLFLSHLLSSFLFLTFFCPSSFSLDFLSIFKSFFLPASYSSSQPFTLSLSLSLSLSLFFSCNIFPTLFLTL